MPIAYGVVLCATAAWFAWIGWVFGVQSARKRSREPDPIVYRAGQRVIVALEPGHNAWLKGTIAGFSTVTDAGRESNVALVRVDADMDDPKKKDRQWNAPMTQIRPLFDGLDGDACPPPEDTGRSGYRGKVGAN